MKQFAIILLFSAFLFPLFAIAAAVPPPPPPPVGGDPIPNPGANPPQSSCPTQTCPPGAVCIQNPLCAATIVDLLNNIINFIFNLAIVITPLMVVIGGFMFVTGSGDAKKLSDARTLLLWTAIGFAVILLSRGLVAVLLSVLGTP